MEKKINFLNDKSRRHRIRFSMHRLLALCCFVLMVAVTNAQVTPPNANSDAECGGDCFDLFNWGPVQDGSGTNVPNYGEGISQEAPCNTIIESTVEYEGNDPNGIDLTGIFLGANLQGTTPWTDTWSLGFDTPLTNPVIDINNLFADSEVCITDCNGAPISLTDISTGTVYASGCFMGNDEVQLSGTFDCFILTVSNDRNDAYTFSVGTCLGLDPLPPCVECGPDESFKYLTLANATGSGTGATADVNLNGVLYGSAEVLFSDLDINEDLTGSKFGAFDSDGGVFLLKIDLCEAITVQQVDILGLETESQTWVGDALSGSGMTGIPTGFTLTQCGGPATMSPTGNMVTNTAASCLNQGSGKYTVGGATTSTLYFRYTNPTGGCSFDKATFRIGACVADPVDAIPVCPVSALTLTNDPDGYAAAILAGGDGSNFTFNVTQDANGNYFNQDCGQIQNEVEGGIAIPQAVISPCAEVIDEVVCSYCDPVPPCVTCGPDETYEYLTLANATGSGTGTTADVLLDGVLYGDAEVLFSDLDINEDLTGAKFGAFDNDGGVFLLQVNLCEPITLQQVDIIGLETESMTWIGSGLSGTGMTGIPTGFTLAQCGGSPTMAPTGNMVTNTAGGCNNQGDGNYTVGGATVSTLFFRYENPTGGCTFDKATFRIGVCIGELPDVAPTCPLSLFEVDENPTNPSNPTFTLYQDVNGNWFQNNICTDPIDEVTLLTPVRISPCATTTFVEECSTCCQFEVTCPTNTDLGTFDCTQLTTIPAAPTTLAAVSAAPYNVVVGDNPCGDIVVMSSDDAVADVCTTGGQTITRTVTIFDDENGNGTYDAATEEAPVVCTFTFEITEDTTVPTVLCDPQDSIHECDGLAGNEAAANAWNAQQIATLTGCSSDICGGITVTSDYNFGNLSDDCGFTGTMTVTFTIVDDCGDNSVTKTATFTVVDTTNPFACDPVDATHECDGLAGNMAAAMAWNNANMAALIACSNDVCGSVVVTNDFDFNNLSDECGLTGNTTVTYTITDDCGNFVTRNATFTVVDMTAPTITCPAGMTLSCFETIPTPAMTPADFIALGGTIDDICTPNLNDFTVFSQDADNGGDNCPGNARVVVRTYFVNDNCGNTTTCEQTYTYLPSTQGPVITSVLPACYKYCASLANPMESDVTYETDCSFGATVSITGPTQIGADNCPGTIMRYTYTVTDDCGRTSAPVTRDFIIGNDGPTIECPTFNLLLECGDENNSDYLAAHAGLVTANSSCDADVTISYFPQNVNNITCNTSTVVTFIATDACGRTASCTTTVNVSDNTAPVMTSVYEDGICNEAVCGSNLNFWYNAWKDKVMEGLSATDACDTNVNISPQGPNTPNQNCPDETTETVVNFVATDNCGNTSYISYSFYVTADGSSEPTSNVSGLVHTASMEAVENVEVYLSGGASFFQQFVTGNDGNYSFNNVPQGQNYSITPLHNQFPMNGVSSYDLVLIAQHILNANQLDSPYKMIAADVNKSGSITTLDLVELRKMILMIETEFSNNTSWRFVDADFVFPNAANPFATSFPEVVNINGLLASVEHDFVGVKVGDVNESAVPNNLTGADDRSFNGNLNFNIDNQFMEAGETYEVVFRSDDFKSINGYQYTLNFDTDLLDFVNLTPGDLEGMSEANFGLSLLNEGAITTSWTNNNSTNMTEATALFSLTFKAKGSVQLSEALEINSRFTAAEAYAQHENDDQVSLLNVGLRFNDSAVEEFEFLLKQNTPNPFRNETVIGFVLPEATNARLSVYDVSGKLLQQIEGDYAAGYNEVSLDRSNLSEGLLYYRLDTPDHSASMKMLLLNK